VVAERGGKRSNKQREYSLIQGAVCAPSDTGP
jgi:hypothetical protein